MSDNVRHRTVALIEEAGVNPYDVYEASIDSFGYEEFVRLANGRKVIDRENECVKTIRREWPEGYGQRIYDTFMAEGGPRP